jgi:hypothetical protein
MKLLICLIILSNTAFSQSNEQILSFLKEANGILVQEVNKNRINVPKFRPKGCPLISTRYEDIYKKFKGIEEGLNAACVNTNKTAISTLNQSISSLDNMYSDYRVTSTPALYDSKGNLIVVTKPEESASPEEWAKYQEKVAERDRLVRQRGVETMAVKNVSTALGTIASMADNKDCKSSFSKDKVFNMISDIIVQTSSIGLLTPTPQGYLLAAGGAAVGSMLKIINEILKEEFDWTNRDARDSFLKVNCSFFDLKKEMDSVGLLHVRIAEHSEEIRNKRDSLKRLDPILKQLYKNEQLLAKKDNIIRKSILMGRMGEENYALLSSLNEAQQLIEIVGPNISSNEGKGEFLEKLYKLHGDILKNLAKADVGRIGKLYYLDSSTKAFVKLLEGANNEDEFLRIYLTDNQKYKNLLENFLEPIQWVYTYQKKLEEKNYIKAKGIAAVVNDPLFKYKSLIWRFENIIDHYNSRIKFLNNITNDTAFSPDDDGTQIKANVIENFRAIEEKIYGKVGASFNSYVLSKVSKDFFEYDINQKYFSNAILPSEKRNQKDLVTQCSNAKRLQLIWSSSHALLNLSYDFMETNKDSFYKPLRKTKMFLFIPYGKSDQKFIADNASSGFLAVEMMAKKDLDLKKLPSGSLGYLMVKLEAEKPSVSVAQKFIDQNKCAK